MSMSPIISQTQKKNRHDQRPHKWTKYCLMRHMNLKLAVCMVEDFGMSRTELLKK